MFSIASVRAFVKILKKPLDKFFAPVLYSISTRRGRETGSEKRGDIIGALELATTQILLLLAVWMDLISEKISNRLILLGLLLGLVRNVLESGWFGIIEFLFDMCFPVIVLFLLYRIRALGAGDIKLFSLLGVWIGLADLFYVVVYSLFIGAAMGLPKLLQNRFKTTRIHFSLAIGLGFLLQTGVRICTS